MSVQMGRAAAISAMIASLLMDCLAVVHLGQLVVELQFAKILLTTYVPEENSVVLLAMSALAISHAVVVAVVEVEVEVEDLPRHRQVGLPPLLCHHHPVFSRPPP
jgi:high-affinity Fe2+/Pb2+ permease